MADRVLKIEDGDTGETSMDIVEVLEGVSIQMGYKAADLSSLSYLSVIVVPRDIDRMIEFLSEIRRGR